MSVGKVGKNRVNGIAGSFPATAGIIFFSSLSLSVSAITLAFACTLEAVSIITPDGIINVYIYIYTDLRRRGLKDVSYVFFSFTRLASDAMTASLEIQRGRACYGRTGKELENTAKEVSIQRATLVFSEHRESPVGVLGESELAI